MQDPAEKTRHALQMAIAAPGLADAADDDHRRRVVARYVFVYLDDVIKFAERWRNQRLNTTTTPSGRRISPASSGSTPPGLTALRRHSELPGGPPSAQPDLLSLYSLPGMSPRALTVLEDFRDWINGSINRTELRGGGGGSARTSTRRHRGPSSRPACWRSTSARSIV